MQGGKLREVELLEAKAKFHGLIEGLRREQEVAEVVQNDRAPKRSGTFRQAGGPGRAGGERSWSPDSQKRYGRRKRERTCSASPLSSWS